ncbi:hypothetical protein BX666DRAFT_2135753 [Dichotomocladium elegans]|nr:hypothetical protein BX666DRAFT_2135753 [Dichotomocladium elegans]
MLISQGEDTFIKEYLTALSSRSVRYGEDYCSRQLPATPRIKRTPMTSAVPATAANNTIDLVVKVLKPASVLTIQSISLDDSVEDLKARIAKQYGHHLTVGRQKLLAKGKVLADNKSLSDYGLVDKAVLNLMISPAPVAAAPANDSKPGRFGLSAEADKKLDDPAFWDAIKGVLVQQLGDEADIVFAKMKGILE